MKFIKDYLQKRVIEKRIDEIFKSGNFCCDIAYPLKNVHGKIEKTGKAFIAFDFLILDRDIFIEGKSLKDAKLYNEILNEITSASETKDFKKIEKEINLGSGADWYHVLVSWVAENQTLTALSNLAIPAGIAVWLFKKIGELRKKYPNAVRIGPASARILAFAETTKQQNFKRLEVVFEYEGSSKETGTGTDYFIFLKGETDKLSQYGFPIIRYYIVKIPWKGESIKVISLNED